MSATKSVLFSDVLKAAIARAGITRVQLSQRLGVSYAQVDKWVNDRVTPSAERQAIILAACERPNRSIATLVESFHADMTKRLAELATDLETLARESQPVSPAIEAEAVSALTGGRKRRA